MNVYRAELYHHGIKGQRWGVRRYQNDDGSLTAAGKERYGSSDSKSQSGNSERAKKIAKTVGVGLLAAGTVAAAAVYVSKHPEVVAKVGQMAKNSGAKVKDLSKNAVKKGSEYVAKQLKNAATGFKEGINEGIKEAPKKAGKAIVTGVTMLAVKKLLDETVGKEEAAKIFQANNNKKIDKFWKVNDDRDKDDEDE